MKILRKGLPFWIMMALLSIPGLAWAGEEAPKIDTGDTTFIMISAALVMLMTPGLALFYGGMVRKKNVLSTTMQSFIVLCLISVQWVLFGYSLAFGPDQNHIVGALSWLGLNGVADEEDLGLDLSLHGEDAYPDIMSGGSLMGGKMFGTAGVSSQVLSKQ